MTESPRAHELDGPAGPLRLWEWPAPESDTAVVFVHGATYPGRAAFGTPVDGTPAWAPWTSARGAAAFALDVRGYGESVLQESRGGAVPPVRTAEAAADLGVALDAVQERFDTVHLVGTSWGTLTCGRYLTETPAHGVRTVTLHAPVYEPPQRVLDRFDLGDPPGEYRLVTRSAARERWHAQLPQEVDVTPWLAAFEAFWTSFADGVQGVDGADAVRAPNGCLFDILANARGERIYDPADVEIPALVVRGSADHTAVREDALDVFDRLGSAPGTKQYAELDGGTHFVHLEPPRRRLFEAVWGFQASGSD